MIKKSIIVICLAATAVSAGAQRQDAEQALQAVFTAASGKAAYVAQLGSAPSETLGQQSPCPADRPFSGEWPANLRCFYDAAGNLDHWAAVYQQSRYQDNFWTGGKLLTEDRVIAGYPAVLQKQRQYNEWVRQNPGLKTPDPRQVIGTNELGGTWYEPPALSETGRLTMGTLLIPYYKSRLSYDELNAAFIARCAIVEGGAAVSGHPCAKPKFIEWNHSTEWIPNYPNADMAEWGRAVEELARARTNLYERVALIAEFKKGDKLDPIDCFGTHERLSCSIGALPQADAAALESLTQAIVAKISLVREIEDAHADDVAAKPVHPVEWINTGGGFEMSKSPVTVEQYAECVQAGQCTEPGAGKSLVECNWGVVGAANTPVNCVSWRQANEYARYKHARLPSPQEYEYASTNGGRTVYPWGDEYKDGIYFLGEVNSGDGFHLRTTAVCANPSSNSASGLCDLLANDFGQWSAERGAAGDMDKPIVMGKVDLYNTNQNSNPNPRRLIMHSRTSLTGGFPDENTGFRLARSAR